jgi:hypothetical protein
VWNKRWRWHTACSPLSESLAKGGLSIDRRGSSHTWKGKWGERPTEIGCILAVIVTGAMSSKGKPQVLDGGSNARVLLTACMDKTIVNKLPVTSQINALGEVENDPEAADKQHGACTGEKGYTSALLPHQS